MAASTVSALAAAHNPSLFGDDLRMEDDQDNLEPPPEHMDTDMAGTDTQLAGDEHGDDPEHVGDAESAIGRDPSIASDGNAFRARGSSVSSLISQEYQGSQATTSEEENVTPFAQAVKYELRPTAFRNTAPFTTWVDKDESGNYDPALEKKRAKKRKACVHISDADDEQQSKKVREDSHTARTDRLARAAARENGESYVVRLDLSPQLLQQVAAGPAAFPYNWPSLTWNTLADPDPKLLKYAFLDESSSSQPKAGRLALRKKEKIRIPDPAGLEPDLFGHPSARGCVTCRIRGDDCSLLHDVTWPCDGCATTGVDCELIIPPKHKQSCEECKRTSTYCTFGEAHISSSSDGGEDADTACAVCEDRGVHCVAGPVEGTLPLRLAIETDWSQVRMKKRQTVECAPCKKYGIVCSLRSMFDSPPCNACIADDTKCTFRLRPKGKGKAVEAPTLRADSPINNAGVHAGGFHDEDILQPTYPHHYLEVDVEKVTSIRTPFRHPIVFEHTPTDLEPCTWCMNSTYGSLGRKREDKFVLPYNNDRSFAELRTVGNSRGRISGALSVKPTVPSFLCISCMMTRLKIVMCEQHIIRDLPGVENLDETTANEMLVRLMENRVRKSDQFCAVCVGIAFYECCAPQEVYGEGEAVGVEGEKKLGCGLLLCDMCAEALQFECDGNIERLVELVGQDAERWALKARADAEFLLGEGLLMRNVLAGGDEG